MSVGLSNNEQARHYQSQGYLRLPAVFEEDEVEVLQRFVQDQFSQFTGNTVMKCYGLYDRHEELMRKTVSNPRLVGALQSLLGPNVVLVKNRHNHATVNNTVGEPAEGLHRDVLQPSRGLLTAAIYLEDATTDNGATRLIPGSHHLPYVGVPQADGGGTWMAEHQEYEGMEEQALPVPMPAGGVLLFNGLAFHGVGANYSGKSRTSITLGYRSVDELDYSPDNERQVLVAGEYIYRGNDH